MKPDHNLRSRRKAVMPPMLLLGLTGIIDECVEHAEKPRITEFPEVDGAESIQGDDVGLFHIVWPTGLGEQSAPTLREKDGK